MVSSPLGEDTRSAPPSRLRRFCETGHFVAAPRGRGRIVQERGVERVPTPSLRKAPRDVRPRLPGLPCSGRPLRMLRWLL